MQILHTAAATSYRALPRIRMDCATTAGRLRRMVFEQRYAWGRAYRDGRLVCWRVQVTIGHDDARLGLAAHERRYVTARFRERLDRGLQAELVALVGQRGAAARRAAERMEPIVIVVDDPHRGRQRMVGRLQPPQVRGVDLCDVEFAVRELPAP